MDLPHLFIDPAAGAPSGGGGGESRRGDGGNGPHICRDPG